MVSDSDGSRARIGGLFIRSVAQVVVLCCHRAPASSQLADPVWLLGLAVIGRLIALSYAEATR